MVLKFYLHDLATSDSGTLPATTATISTTSPIQTPSLTNKSMDSTIGALQKSVAYTTLNNQSAQPEPIVRFLSAPIAAQTLAVQNMGLHWAVSQSNTNSAFITCASIAVWRPSDGSVVGHITDFIPSGANIAASGTTEIAGNTTFTNAAVTAQDGDILVMEVWRDTQLQTMSTAYTNTVFYGGIQEDSATDNAAYILFTNDVAMSTGANPVQSGSMMWPLNDGAALR